MSSFPRFARLDVYKRQLREWVGGSGSFAASTAKRVVYGDASLKAMAQIRTDLSESQGVGRGIDLGDDVHAESLGLLDICLLYTSPLTCRTICS